MKILYKPVGAGGYTILFDEATAAALVGEFPPSFKSTVQRDAMFGSLAELRRPQGNITCTLPISWNQQYTSKALALKSVRDWAVLRNAQVHFQVVQDSETQYYPNAMVDSFTSKVEGVSATHSMQFTSDEVTNTAPP